MMLKLLLPVILIFLTAFTYGQRGGGGGTPFKVEGIVIDTESGQPLEYASVSLLNQQDSSLVGGGITGVDGKFSIDARPGKFIVQVQFISYASKYFNVALSREKMTANLGTINLSPDTETLDEVVITGQKSQMVMELDKRVFNVGQDLSNTGASAADILDNIPSVNVDIEGNVSLRGSGNVRILVNGKPSGLVGISSTDALRQLQGNLIERVEVVTNPSARYEAQGNAGIINIILKKDNNDGINGSFSANAGYPDNYGLSFNVNYRKKWLNLFANYGINYRKNPGSGYANQIFYMKDTTYYTDLTRDRTRGGISNNFRFGSDFYLNDKNTITISALYRISDEENETKLVYRDYDSNRDLVATILRFDEELEDEENIEFSMNYTKTFRSDKQKLTADIQYRESSEIEDAEQTQGLTPKHGESFQPDVFQRSLNDEFESNLLLQADYVHPFAKEGKIEAGYRSTFRKIDNAYLVEELNEQGEYEMLPGFTNDFNYDENIYAAYAIVGNKIGKFSYQVGLRTEVTDITTELVQDNLKNDKNYIGFFPSAHITYRLKGQNSLQASYSRRLDRPGFWSLNPFSSFTDQRNIRVGNPDLDPEYTNSYEVGYLKNWSTASLFTSVYYRHTTGVIDRVRFAEDSITYAIPLNLSSRNAYGVEFTVSKDVGDWWKINGSANFYRSMTDGQYQEQELSNDTYTMSARVTSKMTLFGVLDYQVSGRYNAPQEDTQGRRKAFYMIDMGLSKDVLKGKGTIMFNVRDLLNSRRWRGETITSNFYQESEFQWRARQVTASFTYRLNQKKKRDRGDRDRGDYNGDDADF
ncbi:TonB-dependent receptor, putative [Fulvivirga imtechensis AK7]|uniref:TonB-dependent receptor, putative n=1 Tax=Fulvivirga imtechensis AK7 TaxID=1237149 RepID=L8JMA4_9BACT|nr:outer membrane beta-barrel family protein [Fulvivirga imtechensis]ELR70061.1 TonB-dependent receptor, putative [Fulvivirga imtechensis AK7]